MNKSKGPANVKKYDAQIRDGVASRANRRSTGRPKQFSSDIEAEITDERQSAASRVRVGRGLQKGMGDGSQVRTLKFKSIRRLK